MKKIFSQPLMVSATAAHKYDINLSARLIIIPNLNSITVSTGLSLVECMLIFRLLLRVHDSAGSLNTTIQ